MDVLTNLTDTVSEVPAPTPDFVGEPLSGAARNSFIVLGVFLMISGAFGNLLVLVTLVKCPSLHSTHYVYVANLASADFIIEAYSSPFVMYDLFLGYQPVVNNMHCVFNGFLVVTCYVTSLFTLASISFNRYMHVCQHTLYKRYVTKRLTLFLCAMVWVVSMAVAAGPLLGWGRYAYDVKTHYCGYDRTASISYTATISVGTIALPATAVCYFNLAIFRYVKRAKIKLGKWDKRTDSKKVRPASGSQGDTITSTTDKCGSDTKETNSEPLRSSNQELDDSPLGTGTVLERQSLLQSCTPLGRLVSETPNNADVRNTHISYLNVVHGSWNGRISGLATITSRDSNKTHRLSMKENNQDGSLVNLDTTTTISRRRQYFVDLSSNNRQEIFNLESVIDRWTAQRHINTRTRSLNDIGVSNAVYNADDDEFDNGGVQVVKKFPGGDQLDRVHDEQKKMIVTSEVNREQIKDDLVMNTRRPNQLLGRRNSIPHCLTFLRRNAKETPSPELQKVSHAPWGVTKRLITSKCQTCPLPGSSNRCNDGACRDISRPWCLRWRYTRTCSYPTRTCSYPTSMCQLCRPPGAQNGRKTNRRVKERRRKAFTLRAAASLDTGRFVRPHVPESTISVKDIHMIKTLLAVFICLVIFMSPYMVTTVLDTANQWSALVHLCCSMLAVVNNAINWMLYGLLNKSFRLGYQQVLRSIFKRRRRNRDVS
ncbi:hypothetical protein Btru_067057 [Bulinus truncatus]|nr:hypothetical protein Btru_067057 [Bulinus truncatus]